jgi:Ni/Fe-hydrogenase 1 B-type cytochrome subunit
MAPRNASPRGLHLLHTSVADDGGGAVLAPPSAYVYQLPVRVWHWITALCIPILAVTGYLIGRPPPSLSGEASGHFLFGDIRFLHFAAGQVLIVFFLLRVYWAFVGNRYSRQIFTVPVTDVAWWKGLWFEIRWYAFLERKPRVYLGHNPLAQVSMTMAFILPLVFMMITGLALYGQGEGERSWLNPISQTVFALTGGSMMTHTLHRLGMWMILTFTIIHLYLVVREDIMGEQSIISSMVSGWRAFKTGGRN